MEALATGYGLRGVSSPAPEAGSPTAWRSADGSVWVALARGGCVAVFAPDGAERTRQPVPLPMVTSLCFGGDDLHDLYVVTGSQGGPSENCGTVFRKRVDVPGLLRPLARVTLRSNSPT